MEFIIKKISILIFTLFLVIKSSFCQNPKLGIFTDNLDVGNPKKTGSVIYDEITQTYLLKGGGYNIWFGRDEFQYTYKNNAGELEPWAKVWKLNKEIPLGVKIILNIGGTRFTKMVFIPHGFQEGEKI